MPDKKRLDMQPDTCGVLPEINVDTSQLAQTAKIFAALGDPTRLQILLMLHANSDNAICACDFVTPLNKSQPTISHHLKILYDNGLVEKTKKSTWLWYRLTEKGLHVLSALPLEK